MARLLRAFAFGYSAVLLGVFLENRGLSSFLIGICLGIGLLSGALSGLGFALASARLGRRVTLAAAGVLMALTGIDLAFATSPAMLVLAGITGMLGAASIDLGPFSAVEQAVLAESVLPGRRNVAFGRYSLTGGLAAAGGGLAASLATNVARIQVFLVVYAVIGLLTALIPLLLSARVEGSQPGPTLTRRSMGPLAALSSLIAVDALGGGFVVNAVIAYWLHARFHAGTEVLGPAFAALSIVQAASYEIAGRLANRFGLVRTMVFTHLPSNLLLVLVPFSPSLPWAVGLLLLRFSISQMDVPARQAYIVSIVAPSERAGAVALTGAVRGVAQAVGPVLAGQAIQSAAFGLPFFLAGGLKIAYDLALYAGFRARKADHELA
ncbi:MAG: MFS transporter [Chloroflexi bacterium]|nr:MAG: MFS transporter [Chloroflexota bacterium]